MLADMGAEVIKIEILEKEMIQEVWVLSKMEESMYYANINRNKQGVTLNLSLKKERNI